MVHRKNVGQLNNHILINVIFLLLSVVKSTLKLPYDIVLKYHLVK